MPSVSGVRHLQSQKRTWTSIHDIDEYSYLTISGDMVKNSEKLLSEPGSILKVVKTFTNKNNAPMTQQEEQCYEHFQSSHCVTASPSQELSTVLWKARMPKYQISRQTASFVNAKRFDTLRFRFRGTNRGYRQGPSKSMVDVQYRDSRTAIWTRGPRHIKF